MQRSELDVLARFSRRTALKAVGIGAAGFTLAQADFIRAAAQESDTIQSILDVTATVEQFGITILGEALQANENGDFDMEWPDIVVAVVTNARAQEHYHLETFLSLGGSPMVDTFTVPEELLTNFTSFFRAVAEQEGREIAAQMAAMKAFTSEGRPDLAKVSFQYAAEEAEHRVLAAYTAGDRPANDRAFESDLYENAGDIIDNLRELGLIEGDGTEITFPGPGEIDDSNVTETEPGGPAAACAATGSSSSSSGGTPTGGGTPVPAATPVG
jgi:hypothetical protein